jgi:hypothetical protein
MPELDSLLRSGILECLGSISYHQDEFERALKFFDDALALLHADDVHRVRDDRALQRDSDSLVAQLYTKIAMTYKMKSSSRNWIACTSRCAVRCVRCALCAVRCALCAVRCALCAVLMM